MNSNPACMVFSEFSVSDLARKYLFGKGTMRQCLAHKHGKSFAAISDRKNLNFGFLFYIFHADQLSVTKLESQDC